MIGEIQKHKPEGATHWQSGRYYCKHVTGKWYGLFNNRWKVVKVSDISELCMTTL